MEAMQGEIVVGCSFCVVMGATRKSFYHQKRRCASRGASVWVVRNWDGVAGNSRMAWRGGVICLAGAEADLSNAADGDGWLSGIVVMILGEVRFYTRRASILFGVSAEGGEGTCTIVLLPE